jgi:hypothetical protein
VICDHLETVINFIPLNQENPQVFFFIDDGRMGNKGQVDYPNDVSDEEWAFVAPYLALCREDSEHRDYGLRAVLNGLRFKRARADDGAICPTICFPWTVVYQQTAHGLGDG